MAAPNPYNAPGPHDVFKVKGAAGEIVSPRCKIVECNGREAIASEQQAPGYVGAILVIRGEHLTSVTYEFPMWNPGTFASMDTLAAVLGAAMNARPQLSLKLTDLRLRYMRGGGSFDVTPVMLGHQNLIAAGSWSYKVKFTRNARLKLGGGPVAPPRTDTEVKEVAAREELAAANRDYQAALKANAAKNYGKN
jgi:hypothetical protein